MLINKLGPERVAEALVQANRVFDVSEENGKRAASGRDESCAEGRAVPRTEG